MLLPNHSGFHKAGPHADSSRACGTVVGIGRVEKGFACVHAQAVRAVALWVHREVIQYQGETITTHSPNSTPKLQKERKQEIWLNWAYGDYIH
jgi:hypothetical protein